MNHYVAALLLFSFGLKAGFAQNPFEPDTHVGCVERIQMPAYSPAAIAARVEGIVTASVVLSPQASVQLITTEVKSKTPKLTGLLIDLVEKPITAASFRATCAGTTVVLIFEFKINPRPSDTAKQSTAYGYPNKFWIVAGSN